MRLIDADTFDRCLADAQSECKKNGGNFRYGMLNQVRGNLSEQPTIDAIPVEWLQKQHETSTIYPMILAIECILGAWKKEQETR